MISDTPQLVEAQRALARASSVDEVRKIRDAVQAAAQWGHKARMAKPLVDLACEIKLRAERKAGEMLAKADISGRKGASNRSTPLPDGITRNDSMRWQRISKVPEKLFEQFIREAKDDPVRSPTTEGALCIWAELHRKERHDQQVLQGKMTGKYRVFYADPPWPYRPIGLGASDRSGHRSPNRYGSAQQHYPVMSMEEICGLREEIDRHAADDAVLFLWATSPLLDKALDVMKAWAFQYKASFVWDKQAHNYGNYNSVRHELLLVGTRGSCLPDIMKLFPSVQGHRRSKTHSEKPEAFRNIIDTIYPEGRRIELFARRTVRGWDRWGRGPAEPRATSLFPGE